MTPNLSVVHNGKKFLWDGRVYARREEASLAAETYRTDGFEVFIADEEGKVSVYTRRLVSSNMGMQ